MERIIINTPDAPEAIGPYSQAVIFNNIVYCSGQIGLEPETMEFVSDDKVELQTEQVMKNLGAVLKAAGSSFDNVLKCSIFVADMYDFPVVNEIYSRYFPEDAPPARETIAVRSLPKNARIEISCIATT